MIVNKFSVLFDSLEPNKRGINTIFDLSFFNLDTRFMAKHNRMNGSTSFKVYEKVEIIDTGSEGQSLGKVDNLVVFVNDAVPGDVVDIQIVHKKRNFREGKSVKFHSLSDKRVAPLCQHFGVCGGCKWQHLDYKWQLHYKHKQVVDALQRISKIALPEIAAIIPSDEIYYYRNKLEFTFSNKMWLTAEEIKSSAEFTHRNALGFHIPRMFDKILDINKCYLQIDISNRIRLEVKKYAIENNLTFFDLRDQHGFLRNLIIRTASTGEIMVIVSLFYEDIPAREKLLTHLATTFSQITSLMYVINPKGNDTIADLDVQLYKGNDFIYEQMPDPTTGKLLKFKIGPKSFYQTNSQQAYKLYKVAYDFAGLTGNEVVYDLYTGTGTIANFVAKSAKRVIGIEYIAAAIADARINSQLNGIDNTAFYAGDMKDILSDAFVAENGLPDVIITDPPRAGMHEDVVRKLLTIAAPKIVYVSCNPSTQARDLLLLDSMYKVEKVQPVDMFPQTQHVENVVLLVKR